MSLFVSSRKPNIRVTTVGFTGVIISARTLDYITLHYITLHYASSEIFMTVMFQIEVLWFVTPCHNPEDLDLA
jgi:hypothetical protein